MPTVIEVLLFSTGEPVLQSPLQETESFPRGTILSHDIFTDMHFDEIVNDMIYTGGVLASHKSQMTMQVPPTYSMNTLYLLCSHNIQFQDL